MNERSYALATYLIKKTVNSVLFMDICSYPSIKTTKNKSKIRLSFYYFLQDFLLVLLSSECIPDCFATPA